MLTPGLRLPLIPSHYPHRHRPCRVGLSQAPVPRPDKCRLPPNNSESSSLLLACSTGYWHGVWESIRWGPTAVHTPVPTPSGKRRFPVCVRPQPWLCSGAITTHRHFFSAPLLPILPTLAVVGCLFTTSALRVPSPAIVAQHERIILHQ